MSRATVIAILFEILENRSALDADRIAAAQLLVTLGAL